MMVRQREGHIGKVTQAGNKIFEKAMLIFIASPYTVRTCTMGPNRKEIRML